MRNLLIAVTGLTPHVVTEALFCLIKQKGIVIDEIFVVTTTRGRDVLFGIDEGKNTPKISLKKEILRMCEKYGFKKPKFENSDNHIIVAKEESLEMPDIRNDKQNMLFPNKLCEVLREKASDKDNILHCLVSGGRKTMSIYLSSALSLFGRYEDRLYHVLVPENSENKKFFPETPKEEKELVLSEVPFVRLRPYLPKELRSKKHSFQSVVMRAQKELMNLSGNKMTLFRNKNMIQFGENDAVRMPPVQFGLYLSIVEAKMKNIESKRMKDITRETGSSSDVILSRISKINSVIDKAVNDFDYNVLYNISGPRHHGNEMYGLLAEADTFSIK